MGTEKRKKERIPETLKENEKKFLEKIKKDWFNAWGQLDDKAQTKFLLCLSSPLRWFLYENGKSQQLMRGEWSSWVLKSLEEDISTLLEIRSPSPEIIFWGRLAKEMA